MYVHAWLSFLVATFLTNIIHAQVDIAQCVEKVYLSGTAGVGPGFEIGEPYHYTIGMNIEIGPQTSV